MDYITLYFSKKGKSQSGRAGSRSGVEESIPKSVAELSFFLSGFNFMRGKRGRTTAALFPHQPTKILFDEGSVSAAVKKEGA